MITPRLRARDVEALAWQLNKHLPPVDCRPVDDRPLTSRLTDPAEASARLITNSARALTIHVAAFKYVFLAVLRGESWRH